MVVCMNPCKPKTFIGDRLRIRNYTCIILLCCRFVNLLTAILLPGWLMMRQPVNKPAKAANSLRGEDHIAHIDARRARRSQVEGQKVHT